MEPIRQGDIPGVQLRRRVEIPGRTPEQVWPFLLEPERQCRWVCDRSHLEPGPPTVIRLESGDPSKGVLREYLEVAEQRQPKRLVLGWRELEAGWTAATKVTIEVEGSANGCEVMVFQEGFQKLPLSSGLTAWESARRRWARALARLVRLVGSECPTTR
jgi:uncharacterized protein YndB with AHSA1/START domain